MSAGNNVVVTGNAVRDPELRFTPSGMAVAEFGIAVNRRWQNRQTNEFEESTSFFDVTCWDKLAENVADSVQKGTRVTVSGRLEQKTWESKDGEKRSKVEIVADDVALSLKYATGTVTKNERGEGGNGSARASGNGRGSATAVREAPPVMVPDEEPF